MFLVSFSVLYTLTKGLVFCHPDELAHNNADWGPHVEFDNWVIAIEAGRETFSKGEREKGQHKKAKRRVRQG